MPKVSVIIPTFNSMKYLPQTLESVLNQTYFDFEILVVDDGSSDQTREWVSQLTDPRIKLISQENQGVCVARNVGIANSQGKYIAFLDHDDLWDLTKLEKQVHCLEENSEVGLVHTWMALVDQYGQSTGRVMAFNTQGSVWKQLIERNTIASSSVMVRRVCFEMVGVFSPSRELYTVEDWEMWIRIAERYSFAVIQEPLLSWRQHPNNGSKNWRAMEAAYSLVIEKVFNFASPELLYLKNRSYGHANLCLAWRVLQSGDQDYKQAKRFKDKAFNYYPRLFFSQEYVQLSFAIALMRWLGPRGYPRVLSLLYKLRRQLFPPKDKLFSVK